MCGWKNSIKDNTDWGVQTGNGQSSGPGPDKDHTKNNGAGELIAVLGFVVYFAVLGFIVLYLSCYKMGFLSL